MYGKKATPGLTFRRFLWGGVPYPNTCNIGLHHMGEATSFHTFPAVPCQNGLSRPIRCGCGSPVRPSSAHLDVRPNSAQETPWNTLVPPSSPGRPELMMAAVIARATDTLLVILRPSGVFFDLTGGINVPGWKWEPKQGTQVPRSGNCL